MEKFNLSIITNKEKPELIFLDLTLQETIALVEMHNQDMITCQIQKLNELEVENDATEQARE